MAVLPVQVAVDRELFLRLVLLDDTDSVEEAARKITDRILGAFVPVREQPLTVSHQGRVLDPGLSLGACQVGPMDVLRVAYA
ncbi:toluene-4-monooxygenase system B family protein [Streptomyces sp. NPDC048659]|uniref:toluene-4-monooxygenase system B family protein n=1 Tax=Streptomyces sp. NPDC048659 TaxID=3155489 RepID=UPI00344A6B63